MPSENRVATYSNRSSFPAYLRTDGLLIDLRLLEPDGITLSYQPEKLRACGVSEEHVLAADASSPKGFVLIAS
jgi:hypothetical protein